MLKKAGLVLVLLFFVVTLYGCQASQNACKNTWAGIKKADDWMQKNLW
ncbi:MAG: hypothetical protein PHW54_03770 [Candidatus Omnitrophica bacterium]|jgi:predicted small secreted protein|nr:hypothetical protein [Candidatus Omnitrophota bacterium]